MDRSKKQKLASLLAAALRGSWRRQPDPLDDTTTETVLESIQPLLLGSGAAALAWWKIRKSDLQESESAYALKQAYRYQTLDARLRERQICDALGEFRAADIEPILVKGWAVARHYPELGLRPSGDIDLIVPPRQHSAALAVLARPIHRRYNVDLGHREFNESTVDGRKVEHLYARSLLIAIEHTQVRVLSEEDHLWFLCLHMLRHGAWRPLWLCDIAASLEDRSDQFDWDICLGTDRKKARWISSAILLAHSLLGASLDNLPAAIRNGKPPGWLITETMKQWEMPYAEHHEHLDYAAPLRVRPANPSALASDLRARWPNPIAATVSVNGPFNALPRLPFQLGNGLMRLGKFVSGGKGKR